MSQRRRHSPAPKPRHHVAGRYHNNLRPPMDRGDPSRRARHPGCILAGGLLLAIVSAALAALILLVVLRRPFVPEGGNATWLGISWGETAHTDDEVQKLAGWLRDNGIDTVYVWTSWLQEDNTWSETTFANIGAFVSRFRQFYPEALLYAWIGLPVELPDYRLDDETLQADVAAFAQRTITEFGFGGVYLNAEPIWDGDDNFPALLRLIRQEIGEQIPLSVAVPPDWNTGAAGIPAGPYTTPDAYWSQDYKQLIAFLVDEITVMAYNSGLSTPEDYQTWMAFQVTQFTSAVDLEGVAVHLIIGIPTYDAEPPGHDPAVENVLTALAGIKAGLAQSGAAASRVQGVGIYAYWSTDALEWNAFRQHWLIREAQ